MDCVIFFLFNIYNIGKYFVRVFVVEVRYRFYIRIYVCIRDCVCVCMLKRF